MLNTRFMIVSKWNLLPSLPFLCTATPLIHRHSVNFFPLSLSLLFLCTCFYFPSRFTKPLPFAPLVPTLCPLLPSCPNLPRHFSFCVPSLFAHLSRSMHAYTCNGLYLERHHHRQHHHHHHHHRGFHMGLQLLLAHVCSCWARRLSFI